jgi:flagellar protein FliO/FliZ
MTLFGIFKAIIPLILLVALLYGVLIFVKKYGLSFKNKTQQDSPHVKLISSRMIMPKKFISIVKIEDKLLVLGVSEQSITLLKELDSVSLPVSFPNDEKENFLGILKKNMGFK